MAEQKWTPEPWIGVDTDQHDHVFDKAKRRICSVYGGLTHCRGRYNRDRIVACVNALAGIPDPAAFVARAKEIEKAAKALIHRGKLTGLNTTSLEEALTPPGAPQ